MGSSSEITLYPMSGSVQACCDLTDRAFHAGWVVLWRCEGSETLLNGDFTTYAIEETSDICVESETTADIS